MAKIFRALTILVAAASAWGQWITLKLPDTPRLANGQPNLEAKVEPRDLSGIWQVIRPYGREYNGTGRAGIRLLVPADYEIPFKAEARALREKRDKVDLGAGRPAERCLPHTVPDALFYGPFKLVQTPKLTALLFEEFTFFRQIHTDGRAHPVEPNPAWFGYSVGAWDGDTLVVDTRGFKIGGWLDYGYLDDSGIPYSEKLRVVERFRRVNFGRLHADITVEDPEVFTRPWTFGVDFGLQADTEMIEFVCENERDFSGGHQGK